MNEQELIDRIKELEAALEEITEIAKHADVVTQNDKRILHIASNALDGAK